MENNNVANKENASEIKPKMHVTGTIERIGLAGAIVNIGSAQPAVLHVSQVKNENDEPVNRVDEVLEVGQTFEGWVKRVRGSQIELTMNKPLDLEWREIKPGLVVTGTVVRIENFGAFVEIGAERPGLIHISELAHGYVHAPTDVVQEGAEIEAEVLEVNRRKRQIKLSVKALQPKPEEILKEINAEDRAKPKRGKKSRGKGKNEGQDQGEVADETALGIALREAMERAEQKSTEVQTEKKKKETKDEAQIQDDIIARTLESRSKDE